MPSDAPLADNLVEAAPGQLLPLLGSCTACLTVSSPWSLAAMAWGRIPIVVGDYGIHDEQNTTGFFGCGAMHRLRSIPHLDAITELPRANQAWLDGMGADIANGPERLIEALHAKAQREAMTANATRPTLKLLLIADSDSQLLACEALCSAPTTLNVHWTINVIPRDGTPQALLQRLAERASLRHQGLARLLRDRRLQSFDAIGVFLTGSKLNDIRLALQRDRQRPLLFCGFNGVVLDHFIEGVSWRLGYDLICLSGPRDQDALEQLVAGTPFAQQRTVLTGLRRNAPSTDQFL